jgi:hypothetical protein
MAHPTGASQPPKGAAASSQLRKQQHVHRDLQHKPKGSTCEASRHAPSAIRQQPGAAGSIREALTELSPVAPRLKRRVQPLTSLLAAATACGPFGHTQQWQLNPKSTAAIAFLPPPPPARIHIDPQLADTVCLQLQYRVENTSHAEHSRPPSNIPPIHPCMHPAAQGLLHIDNTPCCPTAAARQAASKPTQPPAQEIPHIWPYAAAEVAALQGSAGLRTAAHGCDSHAGCSMTCLLPEEGSYS